MLPNRFRLRQGHSEPSLHQPLCSGRLLGPGTRLSEAAGQEQRRQRTWLADLRLLCQVPARRQQRETQDEPQPLPVRPFPHSLTRCRSQFTRCVRPRPAPGQLPGPASRDGGGPGWESVPIPTLSWLPPALWEEEFPCVNGEATAPLDLGENSALISCRPGRLWPPVTQRGGPPGEGRSLGLLCRNAEKG